MVSTQAFQQTLEKYYQQHGRHDLPWRQDHSPYAVLVSEVMLQQTQVSRVLPKFQQFMARFPDLQSLAAASLGDVLACWSGLGYNRRAKFLHEAAKKLAVHKNRWTYADLVTCKGIGHNTAAAVLVYAYSQPHIFLETNIRSVYLHHFFGDKTGVSDTEIIPLIEKTLDRDNPRDFYWALMDYGTFLKSTVGNASSRSKHYSKQSKFEGSRRQLRGLVLRTVPPNGIKLTALQSQISDLRLPSIIEELVQERLISLNADKVRLG